MPVARAYYESLVLSQIISQGVIELHTLDFLMLPGGGGYGDAHTYTF